MLEQRRYGPGIGLAAALLFWLLPILSPLPLMCGYLAFGRQLAAFAALVSVAAVGLLAVLGSPANAPMQLAIFVLIMAWPSFYFSRLYRQRLPLEMVVWRLLALAIGVFLAILWRYGVAEVQGQIEAMVAPILERQGYSEAFSAQLTLHTSLMPLGMVVFWMLMLFGNGWLAHWWLRWREQGLARPGFGFSGVHPPIWVPAGLLVVVLIALTGDSELAFIGQCLSLLLLIPYLISGLVNVHRASRHWPARTVGLVVLYVLLLQFLWPAAILAGIGLARHCMALSGRGGS